MWHAMGTSESAANLKGSPLLQMREEGSHPRTHEAEATLKSKDEGEVNGGSGLNRPDRAERRISEEAWERGASIRNQTTTTKEVHVTAEVKNEAKERWWRDFRRGKVEIR